MLLASSRSGIYATVSGKQQAAPSGFSAKAWVSYCVDGCGGGKGGGRADAASGNVPAAAAAAEKVAALARAYAAEHGMLSM